MPSLIESPPSTAWVKTRIEFPHKVYFIDGKLWAHIIQMPNMRIFYDPPTDSFLCHHDYGNELCDTCFDTLSALAEGLDVEFLPTVAECIEDENMEPEPDLSSEGTCLKKSDSSSDSSCS